MAQSKFVNRYTRLDRLLHRSAFSSGGLQVSLADVEDKVFRKQLSRIEIERPVFVTALPRAGTTILLNLLHQTGLFVSHTYRSMPFVLCPVFWHRFSSRLRSRDDHQMERAHGDGIAISIDSPEAFEEIIWGHFWPSHYREHSIEPWGHRTHPEFVGFLKNHIRKLLYLADPDKELRYVSKNNLNIARLSYIGSIFPDAAIVVPFRDPLQHASSLLKQHLGFLQAHKEDKFTREYMRGIGHRDFGDNFLPVNFDNWLHANSRADATKLAFWVEYWVATYRSILRNVGKSVHLISFDQLTHHPKIVLRGLSEKLELERPDRLIDQFDALRSASMHPIDRACVPDGLLNEANVLFEALNAHSLADE